MTIMMWCRPVAPKHRKPKHRQMAAALLLAWQWPAGAQTIEVQSISSAQADLGLIVSAPSSSATFRISPNDGSVTPQGSGVRPGGGSVGALVTMTCTGTGCASATTGVTIAAAGNTGPALPLTAFEVGGGINPPTITNMSGTTPLTFTVGGIGDGETRDFYVGADFSVVAASTETGAATASFSVEVAAGTESGTFQALVFRPISLTKQSNLSFGRIIPSSSGATSVSMDASSGDLNITGTGAVALDRLTPGFAQFEVKGEGGQSFSIVVTPEFSMSLGGDSMTVTTNTNADVAPALNGTIGAEGSYTFRVGGSFTIPESTPAGSYSGTFAVTVTYD